MKAPFDVDEFKSALSYDPETGLFTRLDRKSGKDRRGTIAGAIMRSGHIQIRVCGSLHYAHRLAWVYMTGEWPEAEIDHINGVPSDNRWSNLRDVCRTTNAQNLRKPKVTGRSGFLGVSLRKDTGRYQAFITVERKRKTLGCYATAEDAHAAYLEAKRQLHEGNTL